MPRILLAGMNRYPNQFSRQLDKMGCQAVPLSGDPGGHIPTDCEAVIITKCQSSHEKFWQVKDAYKALNKPVFITDFGFSPIKERFMEFLKNRPKYKPTSKDLASKSLCEAFDQLGKGLKFQLDLDLTRTDNLKESEHPKGRMPVSVNQLKSEAPKMANTEYTRSNVKRKTGPKPGTSRSVHPKTITERVNQIIIECYEAHMSTRETADMLKAEGFKMADGREYTTAYISTIRYRLGLRPKSVPNPKKEGPSKPAAAISKPAPTKITPAPLPEARKASNPLELIGKVLRSKLPQEQKLQVVAKIQAGLITLEHEVIARKTSQGIALISTSIYDPEEKPLLTLNKVQAVAVVQAFTEIEEFVNEA